MAYTKFQFIALETPTDKATDPSGMADTDYVALAVDAAAKANNSINMNGFPDDAKNRLNWLREAVKEAATKELGGEETLKIFAAPEFFFRPQKTTSVTHKLYDPNEDKVTEVKKVERFYKFADAQRVYRLFQYLFSDDSLKDWLIIPGTMVSQEQNSEVTTNRAYAVRGGVAGENAILAKHDKFNTSDVDKIPEASELKLLGPLKKNQDKRYGLQAEWAVNNPFSALGNPSNTFKLDQYWFGIDICLDHGYRILRLTTDKWRGGQDHSARGVDLQLLVACGKPANDGAIATVDKGFLLRIEGNAAKEPVSQVLTTSVNADDGNLRTFEYANARLVSLDSKATKRQRQPKIGGDYSANYPESLRIYVAKEFPQR
jgi:hypothetical protein